jgi:maltose O-acetyltransferase
MFENKRKNISCWKNSLEWIIVNNFISRFPSRHVRLLLLRNMGANIDENVSMFANFEIRNPSGLTIKKNSSIGLRVILDARKKLYIGKSVTIASESIIWTLHHDYNSTDFAVIGDEVVIGDYAWICSRSIILPGVNVGKGAIVASGSVVTKNVDDFDIVGGVPAVKIGKRKEQDYQYIPSYKLHIV